MKHDGYDPAKGRASASGTTPLPRPAREDRRESASAHRGPLVDHAQGVDGMHEKAEEQVMPKAHKVPHIGGVEHVSEHHVGKDGDY